MKPKLTYMRQLSATDAARRSDVLNEVESGEESFVVVRRGRPVARIGPAHSGTGRALKAALRAHPPDPEWAADLHELREEVVKSS